MKRFNSLFFTLFFMGYVGVAFASVKKLRDSIHQIFPKKAFEAVEVGMIVSSMKTKEILYEKNADLLLIPASVAKIFTAYAALKKLKPTHIFKTELLSLAPVRDGDLSGDLYIKGGGDPGLVSERMWMLVNDLRREGIRKISGDLIGDATYFDEETKPQSRPQYLKDQAYNSPIGALSFNFNTTTVFVKPGEKVGSPPKVYSDPENAYIDIVNQAETSKAQSALTLTVTRLEQAKGGMGDTVLLRGGVPEGHEELRFYRNIVNPTLYTVHMFKQFLEQRGVEIKGTVKEGKVPEAAKILLSFESQPLWHIIWGMNKFSNNFVADQTVKKMGAEFWGAPGTLEKGLTVIQECLEELGIQKKSYQLVDGSGLTRNTKITSRQILKTLDAAYHDLSVSSEFIASLGVSGEDGTLKRRLNNGLTRGVVRAKTGSLDGVTSLAGYLTTRENEDLAFVILLNDPKMKYGRMTGWTDKFVETLIRFKRK